MARRDDDFIAFVDARSAVLLQTARLLAAGDQHAAEDVVQTALEAYVGLAADPAHGSAGGLRLLDHDALGDRPDPAALPPG